jgi:hypothetical protein
MAGAPTVINDGDSGDLVAPELQALEIVLSKPA